MSNKKKLNEELKNFDEVAGKDGNIDQKLEEFIILLNNSDLDSENVKKIKNKIEQVLDDKLQKKQALNQIKQVALSDLEKFKQLDQLEFLLRQNHFDSNLAKKINYKLGIYKGLKIIIGFLFVTLGFAMIIMPAPPYFEMFTIFNFNPNDGVTLMDLISLIIIAVGISIIIKSVVNVKSDE